MKQIMLISTLSIIGLAACDSPTPPSISAQDFQNAVTELERVETLPVTQRADLPGGTAKFVGFAGGSVSGDTDGSFLGDMTMNVNFGGNTISGGIDNINLIDDDDTPEQLLGGNLTIAGTESDGALTATAIGNLTAVGDESVRGSSDVNLTMTGNVQTDASAGDTVSGQLSGSGDGDFYINVSNGSFYGSSK